MIPGSFYVPVLDEGWLNSPTMMAALRKRAALDALTTSRAVLLPGPEQSLPATPLGPGYLVYPVARDTAPNAGGELNA